MATLAPTKLSSLGLLSPPGLTFNPPALRDSNDINDLTLAEHTVHRHLLLQPCLSPGHLLSHGTTIQLNLHDVGLLLPKRQQLHLQTQREGQFTSPPTRQMVSPLVTRSLSPLCLFRHYCAPATCWVLEVHHRLRQAASCISGSPTISFQDRLKPSKLWARAQCSGKRRAAPQVEWSGRASLRK